MAVTEQCYSNFLDWRIKKFTQAKDNKFSHNLVLFVPGLTWVKSLMHPGLIDMAKLLTIESRFSSGFATITVS